MKEMAETSGGEFYNYNFPLKTILLASRLKKNLRFLKNNLKFKRDLSTLTRETSALKFVHHHHGYYGIGEIIKQINHIKHDALSKGHEFHFFTCVREPISMTISKVNYARKKKHTRNLTFDDACTNPHYQNSMYKYLLYNHPDRWGNRTPDESLFHKSFNLLDKVFVIQNMPYLENWLENVSGVPLNSKGRRKNRGFHEITPSDEQLIRLRSVNDLDNYFYELALERASDAQVGEP